MRLDRTKKSSRRPPKKADRALGSESVFNAVTRGLQEAGFADAVKTLTLTAARAETHDRVLFGDGRDGLVNDVEHLKTNTQATLTSINLTMGEMKTAVASLVDWRGKLVVKVAVIMAVASTFSAIVGAIVGVVVGSHDFLTALSDFVRGFHG